MRFVIFAHSLVSDWNHGNAHFLRGVASDLNARGHSVQIYEPEDGWSRTNLLQEKGGTEAIAEFALFYPSLRSYSYQEESLDLTKALEDADVVLVHEWSSPNLVRRIGEHHRLHPGYRLLFHDTHHRSATNPAAMAGYDLRFYDGVLAYGNVVRDLYLRNEWARKAWTWHEAADIVRFHPMPDIQKIRDLVWIGNWGDDERTDELREFLIEPVKELQLKATVYGVRYPRAALEELQSAGIEYGGWLPNYRVPEVFAQSRVTVHVPRRPYASSLPGIPTIRPFEALACGVPLVSAPWLDSEKLFRPGRDFLCAGTGSMMVNRLASVLSNRQTAESLAASGLEIVHQRHTCAHRVDELLTLLAEEFD